MKKILITFVCLFSIIACAKAKLSNDKIYLFYSKNCGHCHHAMADIEKNHPKLHIEMIDVAKRDGYNLMLECAKKHNLGNQIGTPLFCIGDNYLMGWSENNRKKFDNLIKDFK